MMPELKFLPVTKAFNRIGATTEKGKPYKTARGISVSADRRHFRFWDDEVVFHDDDTMELHRPPPQDSMWRFESQGEAFYKALVDARESGDSIYVMINRRGGKDQDGNSVAKAAAPVLTAAGLPAPGRVLLVDHASGESRVRLSLSATSEEATVFTDQFDAYESPVSETEVPSRRFTRSLEVRLRVLTRADGRCERPSCRAPAFETQGGVYLETHHVVPLSENGRDSTNNVVALCPNCHRMAHHWIDRSTIRSELLEWLQYVDFGT